MIKIDAISSRTWVTDIYHHTQHLGWSSLQWGECQYFSSSGSCGRPCWNHCSRPRCDSVTLSQWSEHHQLHFDGCSGLSPSGTQPDRKCRPQTGVVLYCSVSLGTQHLLSIYLWLRQSHWHQLITWCLSYWRQIYFGLRKCNCWVEPEQGPHCRDVCVWALYIRTCKYWMTLCIC